MPLSGKEKGSIRRRRVLKQVGAAGTIGLAGMAGCLGGGSGGGDGDGGDTPTATATPTTGGASTEPLKIGAIHPLTGPYGALAEFQQQGTDLAVQALNDSGILDREVQAHHEDSQLDPQTGRQKARSLVEGEGVDMLMGCISSSVGAVVAEFAAGENVPYICSTAANSITMENCQRTTFRYVLRAQMTGVATGPWAVENFGENFWIHNADYSWGNSVGTAWSDAAQAAGGTEVGRTKSELGATDFSSYISQIASSDAEWVGTGLNGGDAVNFLKQAESYGLKGNVDIVSPTNVFQFIRKAAGDAAVGTYATVRYYENFDTAANNDLVNSFTDEYGSPPDAFANIAWVDANMYGRAVAQAGSTETDDVIPALEEVTFDAPMDLADYRACDHQAARDVHVGRIVDPGPYDWPDVEVMDTIPKEDAITPCDQTGCNM